MTAHATTKCFLCQKTLQVGMNKYDGVGVAAWGEQICSSCSRHNPDGVVVSADILERMAERGIEPEYNDEGHIIIPR